MKIQFLGATHTVTGSKYLIEGKKTKILIDCGLFQGYKELRERNWQKLPIDIKQLNFVILTHAHLDHSGYIPLLYKQGFKGKVLCTPPTFDLCKILLPDSGYLQEEEAKYANYKKYSRHNPALPLYTKIDAERSLALFEPVEFNTLISLNKDLSIKFSYAGHILGAASVLVKDENSSILFSGDLGRPNDPIMRAPNPPLVADYYVVESTYGDRIHDPVPPQVQIANAINDTVQRGGTVIIPAFAVGRAQAMLYHIYELQQKKLIPHIPVIVDSPMASDVTKLLIKYQKEHRLSEELCSAVCQMPRYTQTVDESKALNANHASKIIISASGMVTGGRVVHHVYNLGSDPRNTILFCGYQAQGTRGAMIARGDKEIKILGQMVPIAAQVVQLANTSAHVDYLELMSWLKTIKARPKKIFVTHGEINASEALAQRIEHERQWSCVVPEYLSKYSL